MKRIGILGGTFNPVHIGHLAIGQFVGEKLKLDQVIFVPSHLPPHKSHKDVISAKHRFAMVSLAIQGNSLFKISDVEIKREGRSYSIDTLSFFKKTFSTNTKFYFIIGTDSLQTLGTWKDINKLNKLVEFVAVHRPGYKRVGSPYRVKYLPMVPEIEISSSYVRQQLSKGHSVKYLIPNKVLSYIKHHHLYQ